MTKTTKTVKIVTYDFDVVQDIINHLNQIKVAGVDQARHIAIIAQQLETGKVQNEFKNDSNITNINNNDKKENAK